MSLFSLDLLFAQFINDLSQIVNSPFLVLESIFSGLSLSLERFDHGAALLCLSDRCNCPLFLLIEHAPKFASFSLSSLLFFLVEFLQLLVLAVFVDDCAFKAMGFVFQLGNFVVAIIQLALLHLVVLF